MDEPQDPNDHNDEHILTSESQLKRAEANSKRSLDGLLQKRRSSRKRRKLGVSGDGSLQSPLKNELLNKGKNSINEEEVVHQKNLVEEIRKAGSDSLKRKATISDVVHTTSASSIVNSSSISTILGGNESESDHDDFDSSEENYDSAKKTIVSVGMDSSDKDSQREDVRKAIESLVRKRETEICRNVHYVHLSLLLVRIWERSTLANDVRLQKMVKSLISIPEYKCFNKNHLKDLKDMFRSIFSEIDFKVELTSMCLSWKDCLLSQLYKTISDRCIGPSHASILFIALCRSIGLSARIVSKLNPLPPQPSKLEKLFQESQSFDGKQPCLACSPKRKSRFADIPIFEPVKDEDDEEDFVSQKKNKKSNKGKVSSGKKISHSPLNSDCWCEVWVEEENRWVHVDVVYNLIDQFRDMDSSRNSCMYFVSCGVNMKDVTRRYSYRWSVVQQKRFDFDWISRQIASLNRIYQLPGEDPSRESADDDEMSSISMSEPVPSSVNSLRNHPLYCIEKFCKKYEGIYPLEPIVGVVGTHKVYPKENLRLLHTEERWLRNAREVRIAEKPYKSVKSTQSKTEIGLYGEWQTDPWYPPTAENGIVPKNERGHVDLWTEKHLPVGTVHLNYDRIAAAARRIGIDFAPAMTGFDIKKGRWVPVIKGIVVCEENEQLVRDAYLEFEKQRIERERSKRHDKYTKLWKRVVRGAIAVHDMRNRQARKKDKKEESTSSKQEHTHTLNRAFDEETDKWVDRCKCGFTLAFEEF